MATLLEQVEPETGLRPEIVGRNPWALAGRRLRRNRIALAALALFLLHRAAEPARAGVRAPRGAHQQPAGAEPERHHGGRRQGRSRDAAGRGAAETGRNPDRPHLGPAALLPRRRQPRPRRGLAAAVRRPVLAADRDFRGGDLLRGRDRVALIAGFFGGIVDAVLSRIMDIIWAFPVYLLAITSRPSCSPTPTASRSARCASTRGTCGCPHASSRSLTSRTCTGRSAARCSR